MAFSLKNPFLALWLSESKEKEEYKLFHDYVTTEGPELVKKYGEEMRERGFQVGRREEAALQRLNLFREQTKLKEQTFFKKIDDFVAESNEKQRAAKEKGVYRLFSDNTYTFFDTKQDLAIALFNKGLSGPPEDLTISGINSRFDKHYSGIELNKPKLFKVGDKEVSILKFDNPQIIKKDYESFNPEDQYKLLYAGFGLGGASLFRSENVVAVLDTDTSGKDEATG